MLLAPEALTVTPEDQGGKGERRMGEGNERKGEGGRRMSEGNWYEGGGEIGVYGRGRRRREDV